MRPIVFPPVAAVVLEKLDGLSAHRRVGMFVLCCLSITAGFDVRRTTVAAAGPRPNVAITRIAGLTGNVRTADFNRDGKTDLIASRAPAIVDDQPTGGELVLRLGSGDGTFGAERVIAAPNMATPLAAADVDGDGNVDVIALDQFPYEGEDAVRPMWVLPGNGNGTFRASIAIDGYATPPWATETIFALASDFDADGHADLAVGVHPDALHFYPGNGDFTFDPRITMTTGAWPNGATVSDLNGDGRPDVAVATRPTFESGWIGGLVNVFLNNGGFMFGVSSIPVEDAALDVTAADLNGDGRTDLIVSTAFNIPEPGFRNAFGVGRLLVMIGNGNGTFQPEARYNVPRGPVTVVTGDFNRDGILDVATGNTSSNFEEECGPLWNSVSILPGEGNGALAAAASFQFVYDLVPDVGVHSLAAARLDGDSHLDLLASGAALLNRPPAANRPPTANAGNDQTLTDTNDTLLPIRGVASDPDHDLLAYRWTDQAGRVRETCLHPEESLFSPEPLAAGRNTFTLTVTDGRGGTAVDSVVITDATTNHPPELTVHQPGLDIPVPAGDPYTIRWIASDPDGLPIVDVDISVERNGLRAPIPECTNLPGSVSECVWRDPGPPIANAELLFSVTDAHGDTTNIAVRFQVIEALRGALPPGWTNRDVGVVAAAGSAALDGSTFIVRGSGADIWAAADEFHFVSTVVSGDFEVTGRVAAIENVNRWTKAGLMIRESLSAGSRHASIFLTPTTERPVAFQRRPTTNGSSVHTAGPFRPAPGWVMLRRTGNLVAAFYRTSADTPWVAIGTQTLTGLSQSVQVGLAVSSHVDGTVATATFDHVSVASTTPGGLPAGWMCGDAGAVAVRGRCAFEGGDDDSGTFKVTGSGADIWGMADEFSFAAIAASGDFSVTARVLSVQNVNRWTKAGIMIRDADGSMSSAGRRHASFFVTPTTLRGTAFQRRQTEGGTSIHTAGPVTTAPVWLKLIRSADRISAYYRKATTDRWILVGTHAFTGLPQRLTAMLAVSSHVDGTLATAQFDHVRVENVTPMQSSDIGSPAAGITRSAGPEITLEGNGRDIWGAADAFRFHYARWNGNGAITVRVRSLETTHAWAKAGVMFRETLAPGSKHVMAIVSPSKGIAMQYRAAAGGASASTVPALGRAPAWLSLRRIDDRFEAAWSADGQSWHSLGAISIGMKPDIFVGLPVTSHADGTLATAVFDDLLIRR